MAPNIFSYATKELSQDAFFAWFFEWGDKSFKGDPLHTASLEFINFLLSLHNTDSVSDISVKVRVQFFRSDIVAEIGSDKVLLIEDKIHAKESEGQLERYSQAIRREFSERELIPIYLKTGDQSDYSDVHKAGFAVCLREHILKILEPWQSKIRNAIFNDFVANLVKMEAEVQSYTALPVNDWTRSGSWEPWKGFYKYLQRSLQSDVKWDYVANPSGGFLGLWWGFNDWHDPNNGRLHDVYLQIEQGPLCFKIGLAEDELNKGIVRDTWRAELMKEALNFGIELKRPQRLGNGIWMTVARVEQNDWLFQNASGFIDFERTLSYLQKSTQLVQQAANARMAGGLAQK